MKATWRFYKDRQPPIGKPVIVLSASGMMLVAKREESGSLIAVGSFYEIHNPRFWAELPEPPEQWEVNVYDETTFWKEK